MILNSVSGIAGEDHCRYNEKRPRYTFKDSQDYLWGDHNWGNSHDIPYLQNQTPILQSNVLNRHEHAGQRSLGGFADVSDHCIDRLPGVYRSNNDSGIC